MYVSVGTYPKHALQFFSYIAQYEFVNGNRSSTFVFFVCARVEIDNVGNLALAPSAVARYTNEFIMETIIYHDNILPESMSRSSTQVKHEGIELFFIKVIMSYLVRCNPSLRELF